MSKPDRDPEATFADDEDEDRPLRSPRTWYHRFWVVCRKHTSFIGPGILASVAYFDPGNWATDLAAGSEYGYALLFVVLCAGLGAILFQTLSCRLGIVTGRDLAQHLRARLHSRPKRTLLWRWGVLYPHYAICEIAIIATDMAELLGSAIALNLLIPKLPLYGGVLITAADVLLILVAYRPNGGARSMRLFEVLIACLVFSVFVCFLILLVRISPSWGPVFKGYIPSKVILQPSALYTSIGIVGATVMPHALFLGSRLSTIDRLVPTPSSSARSSTTDFSESPPSLRGETYDHSPKYIRALRRLVTHTGDDEENEAAQFAGKIGGGKFGMTGAPQTWERDGKVIRTHVRHASIDIILSLFCFAITINSAILIVAAAAFYYGAGRGTVDVGDLFDAHALIKAYIGKGSAFLFAFALLCAGQSASITATLAGQVVSEGFLKWRLSPFLRRIITRLIGIIPSVAISVALGRKGLDTLLVASQVVLSIVLPFVVFPLVYFTSSRSGLMKVRVRPKRSKKGSEEIQLGRIAKDGNDATATDQQLSASVSPKPPSDDGITASQLPPQPTEHSADEPQYMDFSSPWYISALGYLLFVVMLAANMYVIVQLARGE